MSVFSLILGLWPGLTGLVRYGRGIFLILAAGFGMLASMTLFCCGFWTELIAVESKWWLAGGLAFSWLVLTLVSSALSASYSGQLAYDEDGCRFRMALDAYLAANWPEAEKIAKAVLKRNRRDPEILLLLATLCRHTGRLAEAGAYLDRLESLETAEKWADEIKIERAEICELEESGDENPDILPFPVPSEDNSEETAELQKRRMAT